MPKIGERGPATSAMKSTTTFKVSVLRCRKTTQVLFLEAGKDFVDSLFSFLLLPVGTIIHMLSKAGTRFDDVQVKPLGGISSIFKSMEKLDCSFLHVEKKLLLQPKPVVAGTCRSTGLLKGLEAAKFHWTPIKLPAIYYQCSACEQTISDRQDARCDSCGPGHGICTRQQFVVSKDLERLEGEILKLLEGPVKEATCSTDQGFVRENITYMITDNLEVMPSTTIKSIQVLNKLKVATLADLECTDTIVSITQMLQLLQSAFTSNSCLNDVFGMK